MSGVLRRGRRLAVDVGDARIGVASCDPDGILATPVETVPGRDVPAAHRRLAALVEEYEPIEVVVRGPPRPQGRAGPAAGHGPRVPPAQPRAHPPRPGRRGRHRQC
ncbi:Holliday junction resolvase RuvX, partial [Streptomyces albidoflavus]